MVEGAIVIGVFLTMLLGMLDLALANLQKNMLTEGAQRVARAAMVHGSMAPPEETAWGPAEYFGFAGDATEMAAALRPVLVTIDPSETSIRIQWLDGGNEPGQRVHVTVVYDHQSLFPFLFGAKLRLKSVSVMRIAH